MGDPLRAPMPWFGGKSRIAAEVWARIGNTPNYVEPFFGSGAVLLARPDWHRWRGRIETVNDLDGMVSNFWRAVAADPDGVARHADWIVSENDLHARHAWLVGQRASMTARLEGDPAWFDARIAGWWVWGLCSWIGSGWCSGQGPWTVEEGCLVRGDAGQGISRRLPHLQRPQGINRQLPHLGDAGVGINRQLPHLRNAGMGINRKLPDRHTGGGQQDVWSRHLEVVMGQLSDRLRRVRVCSGDWARVCGETPTVVQGTTGVFLDPPYGHAERRVGVYAEDHDVASSVRHWAVERGDDPRYRIALCCYQDEHEMPANWVAVAWKGHGGYGLLGNGRGRVNAGREVVWFSPHCLRPDSGQLGLMMASTERVVE